MQAASDLVSGLMALLYVPPAQGPQSSAPVDRPAPVAMASYHSVPRHKLEKTFAGRVTNLFVYPECIHNRLLHHCRRRRIHLYLLDRIGHTRKYLFFV